MTYQFREGFRLKSDPQVAGERLEQLMNRNGGSLTPEVVLDDAQRVNSPLHDEFEWDDTEAARQHRLTQARYIVRSVIEVQVSFKPEDKEQKKPMSVSIRAFPSVKEGDRKVYKTMGQVMSDPDLREQLLAEARSKLSTWRKTYNGLRELAAVYEAIDSVVEE